jgi:hypothetical protein
MTSWDLFDKYLEPRRQQEADRERALKHYHDQRLINQANEGIQEFARAAAGRLSRAHVPLTPVSIYESRWRRSLLGRKEGIDTVVFPSSHPRVIAASDLCPCWCLNTAGVGIGGHIDITQLGQAIQCIGHSCPPRGPILKPTIRPIVVDCAVDPRDAHYVAADRGANLEYGWSIDASDLAGRAYHMNVGPCYYDELIAAATVSLLP